MDKRNRKSTRIQDSIHGIVELSPIERLVVDSLPFQRLLNVKQLGMAYAVFPGADYSRFSHCIGVSSIMARWLETLSHAGMAIDEPKKRLYRLAALLHDIGHYPFSHTLEHAVEEYYKAKDDKEGKVGENYLDHENIGRCIVAENAELNEALVEIGLNLDTLKNIFARTDSTKLDPLLSSDLDADRIDYLRRTAHHTGLPYGRVDIQYLITELRLDDLGRPCWTERALRALDQLLLCRFFDYQQIVYNKTVIGLEMVLAKLVHKMLSMPVGDGGLDLSKPAILEMLKGDQWPQFDDHDVFQRIKKLRENSDETTQLLCNSLLQRNPPRQIYFDEFSAKSTERNRYTEWVRAIETAIPRWSEKYDIDPARWFVWKRDFKFVDYAWDTEMEPEDPLYSKLPRVLKSNGTSLPLVLHPSSLLRSSYLNRMYSTRIYVLWPVEEAYGEKRYIISKDIAKEVNDMKLSFLTQTSQTSIFDIA